MGEYAISWEREEVTLSESREGRKKKREGGREGGRYRRRDVPVNDVGGLQKFQREEKLVNKCLNVIVGELLRGKDELVQVRIHVLEDEVQVGEGRVGAGVDAVEEGDHVGVVAREGGRDEGRGE